MKLRISMVLVYAMMFLLAAGSAFKLSDDAVTYLIGLLFHG